MCCGLQKGGGGRGVVSKWAEGEGVWSPKSWRGKGVVSKGVEGTIGVVYKGWRGKGCGLQEGGGVWSPNVWMGKGVWPPNRWRGKGCGLQQGGGERGVVYSRGFLPLEVVLEATAFSLMSLRVDEPLVATMVSTLFFFSAAELAWDWVSMATVHSSAPHQDGTPERGTSHR